MTTTVVRFKNPGGPEPEDDGRSLRAGSCVEISPQEVAALCPAVFVPNGQEVQLVESASLLNVFTSHGLQLFPLMYDPAGQTTTEQCH